VAELVAAESGDRIQMQRIFITTSLTGFTHAMTDFTNKKIVHSMPD
jgi:hypothetical protein